MVKVLVIGDFHGKLSKELLNKIKKESPDIILSPGDFCGNDEWARLFFKYVYHSDEDVPKRIEKRLDVLERKSVKDGIEIIKKLKN